MRLLGFVAMLAGCAVFWAGAFAAAFLSVPLGAAGLVLGMCIVVAGICVVRMEDEDA